MLRVLLAALAAVFFLPSSLLTAAPSDRTPETEPVRLETSDDQALYGDFFAPKGVRGKAQPVLMLHAPGSDRSTLTDLAEILRKKKLAVLILDLRGHGESANEETDWTKLDEEQRANLWTYAIRDVEAAAAWLRKRDDVHSTSLSLVGVGASSALAAHYSVSDSGVRALMMLEPFVEVSYGFNLQRSLWELEGLPIRAIVSRDRRADTESKITELELDGIVEIQAIKAEPSALLAEARALRGLGEWVAEPAPVTESSKR